MEPLTILSLPNEILLLIADNLDVSTTLYDLSALARTNRRLYLLLNTSLYTLALDPDSYDRIPSRASILLDVVLNERLSSIGPLLEHAGSEREWSLSRLLRLALENRKKSVVHDLLERGVDVNRSKDGHCLEPFLHVAVTSGMVEIAHLLLQHGGDVNLKDTNGGTALSRASSAADWEMMFMLLDNAAILREQIAI
jgi:ankyrin repeat protein